MSGIDEINVDKLISMWIIDHTLPEGGYWIGRSKKPLLGKMEWEDGTPFEPPKNPLMEKWLEKYPPTPMPQFSQVCDGWSCEYCGRCPHGSDWKVPEEDLKEYNKWLEEKENYIKKHGGVENLYFPLQMSMEEWENQ